MYSYISFNCLCVCKLHIEQQGLLSEVMCLQFVDVLDFLAFFYRTYIDILYNPLWHAGFEILEPNFQYYITSI